MAEEFKLPELGGDAQSGDVLEVLVAEGDEIAAEQEVIEIETDKASMPVPCPFPGKVAKIHVAKGDTISVGDVILSIERNGQPRDEQQATQTEEKKETAEKAEKKETAEGAEHAEGEEEKTDKRERAGMRREGDAGETKAEADDVARGHGQPSSRVEGQENGQRQEAARREPRAPEVPEYVEVSTPDLAPPASPETRRFARELGVDIRQVRGTGSGGRITKGDVTSAVRDTFIKTALTPVAEGGGRLEGKEKAAEGRKTADGTRGSSQARVPATVGEPGRDAWGPVRVAKLSKMRETIAANMARSSATIPHVTNFDDADITELERIRKGSMADYLGDVKLTMMSFVLKACALALKQHPTINASLDLENKQVIHKEYVHIGVAVDTDRGLVVPVLRDVDKMTIPNVAAALTKLAADARDSRYKIEDLRGGTFTISNLGAIGGTYSTPIINYPEVAILLVGRSRKLPVVIEDEVKIRLMMPLSLSYDHRLVDGAAAGRFLNQVKEYLETPGRLLLAP